jgi:hypothetical protein
MFNLLMVSAWLLDGQRITTGPENAPGEMVGRLLGCAVEVIEVCLGGEPLLEEQLATRAIAMAAAPTVVVAASFLIIVPFGPERVPGVSHREVWIFLAAS